MKNIKWYFSTISIMFLCISCTNKQNIERILQSNENSDFVALQYRKKHPIVQLINMPDYTERQTTFTLEKDNDIQVYAVGELLFNIKDEEKKYYLKSDDIDLYFKILSDSLSPSSRLENIRHFNISMANDKNDLKKEGIIVKWYKEEGYYVSQISIPWCWLNIGKPKVGVSIPFDVSIGDNDNNFMQESKLAWSSHKDNILNDTNQYGTLLLTRQKGKHTNLLASQFTPANDSIIDSRWKNAPVQTIGNVVYGFVKDSLDLSATIQSAWDNQFLYLLVWVTDQRLRRIFYNRKEDHKIFTDYGWIENQKGDTVWEMLAQHSRYAGGAYKNQKIDTVLHLKKGTYTVKYVTDESHSCNNWNDQQPATPFYGIVIYDAL